MKVTIRRITVADAPEIHAIRSELGARRYQPLRQIPLEEFRATIANRCGLPLDSALQGKVQWVIAVEDRPAGWVSLDVTSRDHGIATVGYTVAEVFRGRGVATEAVKLIVDLAFDPGRLALERLEAVAAVTNSASRRVLVKSGFREEGVARGLLLIDGIRVDHMRFGMLCTDLG
jgi:RimJ/RimL family protein N-acetyltransferase